MRLIFVHGRSQGGKDSGALQDLWQATLVDGFKNAGLEKPAGMEVAFPYYGDELDRLVKEIDSPSIIDVATKGVGISDKDTVFRAELALELARNANLTNDDIEAELAEDFVRERGPLQWEWVHAILRALDKHKHIREAALDQFTRDVFVYLTYPAVAKRIDDIVANVVRGEGPCIVIGHSLGSIVAYKVLIGFKNTVEINAFITVGSPLGLNSIRNHLPLPLAMPAGVKRWANAYDKRDVVALLPLDRSTWDINPEIENFSDVHNQTDNAHGIAGYLNSPIVAKWVAESSK